MRHFARQESWRVWIRNVHKAVSQERVTGRVLAVSMLLACLLAASCSGFRSEKQGSQRKELVTAEQLRFSDLPIPQGFRLRSSRSWDYEREGFRLCSHLYEGRASMAEVTDFFKNQMPVSSWRLTSEYLDSGVKVMNFNKANETCVIRIAARGRKIRLWVRLDRSYLR